MYHTWIQRFFLDVQRKKLTTTQSWSRLRGGICPLNYIAIHCHTCESQRSINIDLMELNYDPQKIINDLNLKIELVIAFVLIYFVRMVLQCCYNTKVIKVCKTCCHSYGCHSDAIICFAFGDTALEMPPFQLSTDLANGLEEAISVRILFWKMVRR